MQSTYALLLLVRWNYGSSELGTVLLCSGFVIAGVQGGQYLLHTSFILSYVVVRPHL